MDQNQLHIFYRSLEERLNRERKLYSEFGSQSSQLGVIIGIERTPFVLSYIADESTSRLWIPHDGKIIKVKPSSRITPEGSPLEFFFRGHDAPSSKYPRIEEVTADLLARYGCTSEAGFYVPAHHVFGISFQNERYVIHSAGVGWTVMDDPAEGGRYEIDHVNPDRFSTYANSSELDEQYRRYIQQLTIIYEHPNIRPLALRHEDPDPELMLRRMLHLRVKDCVGEVYIGDLDNILFEEKDQ